MNRRTALGLLASVGVVPSGLAFGRQPGASLIRPPRLRVGDVVGLTSPATAAFETDPIEVFMDAFREVGLEPRLGANFYNRRGYFAGSDEDRAADVMGFFADPEVKGIFARGGWGSARVLPHLDYDLIRRNPKVLLGYSDATALLMGVHAKTGLITMHGPGPGNRFSTEHFRRVLMEGEAGLLENLRDEPGEYIVRREHRIRTITPGTVRGRLLGGNLTVLSAIVGSDYLPDFTGAILFLEDVDEAVYRVDRMLTTLRLAGILERLAGFVFGRCTDCDPSSGFGSLTLEEVLADHIEPLGIPALRGSMIGHIPEQFTLPIGGPAELDADAGTIHLLEPAVQASGANAPKGQRSVQPLQPVPSASRPPDRMPLEKEVG